MTADEQSNKHRVKCEHRFTVITTNEEVDAISSPDQRTAVTQSLTTSQITVKPSLLMSQTLLSCSPTSGPGLVPHSEDNCTPSIQFLDRIHQMLLVSWVTQCHKSFAGLQYRIYRFYCRSVAIRESPPRSTQNNFRLRTTAHNTRAIETFTFQNAAFRTSLSDDIFA